MFSSGTGQFDYYLVKSRVDVVSKLYLSNSSGAGSSNPDTKTNNTLLTQGRVEYSITT